jgi:Alpha-L-arabinofuranosidase
MIESSPATTADPDRTVEFHLLDVIGRADPRLFGSFVEHVGRGVYGGLYEPGHPSATSDGFRSDVLELVAELGVTVIRYPGGNFVSGYDWRDGIGPRDLRPRRLDLAWKTIEPNTFGTDEFLHWCRLAGVEPMLALNLGLGNVASSLQLLEYVNHPEGTALSDERIRNGNPEPGGVRLWCLGNELDGPWQLGAKTASEYSRTARAAAAAMRMFDPDLELSAVGSSNADMATFGAWERTVLAETVDLVDYLSCHIYFYNDGDLRRFLTSADKLGAFLDEIAGMIAEAKRANPAARDVRISLDEWNVWDFRAHDAIAADLVFEQAPRLLEQTYTLADAVVVGTLLQAILARADVIGIAAMAQLVNAIGAISAEPDLPAWRQTIFHPFALAARSAGHTVVRTSPAVDSDVLVTVTVAAEGDLCRILLANTSLNGALGVTVDLASLHPIGIESAQCLWDDDPMAANTIDAPDRVHPRPLGATLDDQRMTTVLPPLSWAAIDVSCRAEG